MVLKLFPSVLLTVGCLDSLWVRLGLIPRLLILTEISFQYMTLHVFVKTIIVNMYVVIYESKMNLHDRATKSKLDHLLSSSVKLYLMIMHWWAFHKLSVSCKLLNSLSINTMPCSSEISLNYDNLYYNLTVFTLLTLINRTYHTMAEKKPLGDPLFNPNSHYYLKNNDQGPLPIKNILQGSVNYYPWNKEMTTALLTRRKLGFVLGTMREPSDNKSEEHEA